MEMKVNVIRERHYDVAVAGGGTAGFCAAVAAARNGARTAVFERFGMFGGTMTVGGINAPALFHAHGRQIIAGIGWELMKRLADKGFASLPEAPFDAPHPLLAVELNVFQAATEMDEMAIEAGVDVCFHQSVVSVEAENGHVKSMLVSTPEGLERIIAQVFIDCSGDGILSALAGAEFELTEELQPATLCFTLSNYDIRPEDRDTVRALYEKALENGELMPEDIWGGGVGSIIGGRGRAHSAGPCWQQNPGSNVNHVYPFNGASAQSRTDGEISARRSIRRLLAWLNKNAPGYEKAFISAITPSVSARESRRILGNAYIIGDDYINGKWDENSVCYSFYPIDVHRGDTKSALDNEFHQKGLVPGIPYGALTARGFDNLMMAGRIASGDRRAQSAYRVQASCMAMGQAAGTAAALSCRQDVSVNTVDVKALRDTLAAQGAIVPGLE